MKKLLMVLLLLGLIGGLLWAVACSGGDDDDSSSSLDDGDTADDDDNTGPPDAAYDACEGKSVGDDCQFEDANGTVSGKCEDIEGDMVCVPDDAMPDDDDDDTPPPQDAIDACVGKDVGDDCSFEGMQGTVNGTCEEIGSDLVCVPGGLTDDDDDDLSPPQEAIDACEELEEGDDCEFTDAQNHDVVGKCTTIGDDLVCVPEGPPPAK